MADLGEQGDATPTSEVGCAQAQTAETEADKWRYLFEQQNKNFSALLQTLKSPAVDKKIHLPEFDPHNKNADSRSWLATADMCITDQPLTGARLMISLSKALKGQAASWLSQISYPGMTWQDFKEIFDARYNNAETPAAFLINTNNNKPKEGECVAAFAAGQVSLLMSRWKNLNIEEIAVATVLAQISQFENKVQHLAFTTEIKTRQNLQQELAAFSFSKRKLPLERDVSDPKRIKSNIASHIKCFNCGKIGHKSKVCRSIKISNFKTQHGGMSSPRATSNTGKMVTCFKCNKSGHYASRCPFPKKSEANNDAGSSRAGPSAERRVDVCLINTPSGSLRHHAESHEDV